MKYIQQPNGTYSSFDENSAEYIALTALDSTRRPTFLDATNPDVQSYFIAKAEAAKPQEVTMRQARLALLGASLLPTVEAAIASMTGNAGTSARIEWEYSNSLKRTQPLVMHLAMGLGLTSEQLDDLFLTASTL